jgi:signal transduction histidine kinase
LTGFQRPFATLVLTLGGLIFAVLLISFVRQTAVRTQTLLDASERAERASAAKSVFLATISHEIRTPMNAVVSAANLLKRTEMTPEQTECLDMLQQASEVLTALLDDVLDISKIEAASSRRRSPTCGCMPSSKA